MRTAHHANGVIVLTYPNDTEQITITVILSYSFFVVSEELTPYESASDTWVSRSRHILILTYFFTMFDVLLLRVVVWKESSHSQRILAGVFVAGHAVTFVGVV